MIKIFVGDVGDYLAQAAKAADSQARLITPDSGLVLSPGTYYISYGDLQDVGLFASFLKQADELVMCPPPGAWSDSVSAMSEITQQIVSMIQSTRGQQQLGIPEHVYRLVGGRITQDPQLWIAGDSISHGMGVHPHERYGELLAQSLDRPVTYLTQVSSSIGWAADQISRSDIRRSDIVVWGLTSRHRFTYYSKNNYWNVVPNFDIPGDFSVSQQQCLRERQIDDDTVYQSVLAVLRTKNFCQVTGARLILIDMFADNFQEFLSQDPDYISVSQVDRGFDQGRHPGPITHQRYADRARWLVKNENF